MGAEGSVHVIALFAAHLAHVVVCTQIISSRLCILLGHAAAAAADILRHYEVNMAGKRYANKPQT